MPHKSLIEHGYILTNTIEENGDETLKVILTKIEQDIPDLKLPFCCCKLIIEKILYYNIDFI
jgi:hypothetical protein